MSLEQGIRDAVSLANQPLLAMCQELLGKISKMEIELTDLRKSSEKPLSIKECCELLNGINRDTFRRYRKQYNLKPCGGTNERPLFHRADVLKLKKS